MLHLVSLGRHILLSPNRNMQPLQRSARLQQAMEITETPPILFPSPGLSTSRKRQRKRCSSSAPPPPESPPPDVGSLFASSDDEDDNFLPKDPRYEASREIFQARSREFPDLLRPKRKPITARFISVAATERYKALKHRNFVTQQSISLTEERLSDVKKVVVDAGLIYTVINSDSFQPTVVREFVANLLDVDERDDGDVFYVRGSLVDFSPSLINSMYYMRGFEEDPNWLDENIDQVFALLADNRIKCWENMS